MIEIFFRSEVGSFEGKSTRISRFFKTKSLFAFSQHHDSDRTEALINNLFKVLSCRKLMMETLMQEVEPKRFDDYGFEYGDVYGLIEFQQFLNYQK